MYILLYPPFPVSSIHYHSKLELLKLRGASKIMSHSLTPNPAQYDPISTLEKQQYGPCHTGFLGRRIVAIVSLNAQCFISGGVQTVIRRGGGGGIAYDIPSTKLADSTHKVTPCSSQGSFSALVAEETAVDTASSITSDFAGMNLTMDAGSAARTNDTLTSSSHSGSGAGWGSKLAKLAKSTQQHIERKVTSIAIQAQKVNAGGDGTNTDILSVGAYAQNPVTGEWDTCCGMTEPQEIPLLHTEGDAMLTSSTTGIIMEDLLAMTFRIPIYIPPEITLNSQSVIAGATIQFKLWIRSSLTFLPKTYFHVGSAILRVSHLMTTLQQQHTPANYSGGTVLLPTTMTLPLQSSIVTGAKVTLTILSDMKFPPLCGLGWSLTDPRIDVAYFSHPEKRLLFNPPLDATFVFDNNVTSLATNATNISSRSLIIATERTTESTLILPIAYAYHRLLTQAAFTSVSHLSKLTSEIRFLDHAQAMQDPIKAMENGHAQCQLDICYFIPQQNASHTTIKTSTTATELSSNKTFVSLYMLRPDSVFEKFLSSGYIPKYIQTPNTMNIAMSIPFYPKIISNNDKRLLPMERIGIHAQRSLFIGSIRIEISSRSEDGSIDRINNSTNLLRSDTAKTETFESIIDMEYFLDHPTDSFVQIPVCHPKSGQHVGILICKMQVNVIPTRNSSSYTSGDDSFKTGNLKGLYSFVGLESLIDECCYPALDATPSTSKEDERRKRQLETMGEWLYFDFMNTLLIERERDLKDLQQRTEAYRVALSNHPSSGPVQIDTIPPSKRREPLAFRPSSSRGESLLSGIGFNVHVESVSLSLIQINSNNGVSSPLHSTSSHQCITCGAPADHYRGFGPKGTDAKLTSGGLRRLEGARGNAVEQLETIQNGLIQTVSQYFQSQQNLPVRRRVPRSDEKVLQLRKDARSILEYYHKISWETAIRRGNVFSQALGIAVTCYLTLISDVIRMQNYNWAELWKKYGFLISFEGLLSTAGKELGMIEDASIAISMLRMVSLVLLSDDQNRCSTSTSIVPVFESPYVRWVDIIPSGSGSTQRYRVEIGLDPQYYIRLVPPPLRDGTLVQIYPVFFQMGVDIRQWGANMRANNFSPLIPGLSNENGETTEAEIDEDEVGIADNDILIALNLEALQKLNAYAHFVQPISSNPTPMSWEESNTQGPLRQAIHPSLSELYELIRNSSAKMEHGVLDKAGAAILQLGGGGAIFCKSGKDRTAMQVTYKESQFINKFISSNRSYDERVFEVASVLRLHGTRLPICEKNVGQALYAFNSLQVKFMPPELKPPPQTLAGFLKRGKVFSREGGIES